MKTRPDADQPRRRFHPTVSRWLAMAAALGVLLVTSLAAAQTTPSVADRETARALVKQGDASFTAKDYPAALKAYEAAHATMNAPTTGVLVARARVELGKLIEARAVLLEIGRSTAAPGEPPAYTAARKEAADLADKLAGRIPTLTIRVQGPPSGASLHVDLDGASIPAAAVGEARKLDPGEHEIAVCAPGFAKKASKFAMAAGDTKDLDVALVVDAAETCGEEAAKPAPVEAGSTGQVEVLSETPGEVYVDGDRKGKTPITVSGVSPGAHRVRIVFDGGSDLERTAYITEGYTARVRFELSPNDKAGAYREGVTIGGSAGPSLLFLADANSVAIGGAVNGLVNVGIIPAIDFRTGLSLSFSFVTEYEEPLVGFQIPAIFRFNLGSVYTIAFGGSVGFETTFDGYNEVMGGPQWSFLSFRFGERRQFEVELAQGVVMNADEAIYHQDITFGMLAL